MAKKKQASDQQAEQSAAAKYRTRIREFIPDCDVTELKPHPNNWRLHPEHQKELLSGMLSRIGKIDAILAYESPRYGGKVIIDGHQRQSLDGRYPVILLDVSDAEADVILASYNPFAQMAQADTESYRNLVAQIAEREADDLQAVQELAKNVLGEEIVAEADPDDVVLKRVDVKPPPQMIWTVIGIPVNEFGSVNRIVEQLQAVPNVIIEMTSSDWKPKPKGAS